MRTRCSRASSVGAEGARICGAVAGRRLGPRFNASSTSPFRTWPRLPLPETSAAEIPFSSISLRAAGAGGISITDAPDFCG